MAIHCLKTGIRQKNTNYSPMKRLFIILSILVFSASVQAQSELLEKANQLFADQKYNEAIEAYQQILGTGKASEEVYYNLGNAYYKTNQFTQAILNYERAKLLAPNDEDIAFNLALANQHVVDAIDELPQVFFVRWWHSLLNLHDADGWGAFSVVSFFIFLILLGLFVFSSASNLKKLSFWAGTFVLLFSVFTFIFASKQKARITGHDYAIVTQASVTVKSSPSETGTGLFLIHEGLKVQVTDKLGEWSEIRLADGNRGWLLTTAIEKI